MLAEEAVKELQISFSGYYVCLRTLNCVPKCRKILIIAAWRIRRTFLLPPQL